METKLNLTDKQIKEFERIWFIFGNSGKKSTLFNHKLVQGFYESRENRIDAYRDGTKNIVEKYGQAEADKMAVTEECIAACELILNNP